MSTAKRTAILIVADEGSIADQIRQLFVRQGYQHTEMTVPGEAALKKIKSSNPDLTILNMDLAGCQETITIMDQLPGLGNVPVICVISGPEQAVMARIQNERTIHFLQHSVTDDKLMEVVEATLHSNDAEQTPRLVEAHQSAILNTMPEGFCLHEMVHDDAGKAQDYRILHLNPQCEKILDLDRKDVVGKLATEIFGRDEAPHLEAFAKVADTGQPTSFETHIPSVDKYFSVSVFSPAKGQSAAILTDVTEQKRAAAEMDHLNRVLQSIRNVNQLITHEKDTGRLIDQTCQLLVEQGYDRAWLVLLNEDLTVAASAQAGHGKEFARLLKHFRKASLNECARRALKSSGIISISDPESICGDCPLLGLMPGSRAMTIRLEHDKRIYGLLSVQAPAEFVANENEQALFHEVAGDIAFALHSIEVEQENKRTEEELVRSARFNEALLDAVPTPVFFKDREGLYLGCNRAFTEIMGVTAEEIRGKTVYELWPSEHAEMYHRKDIELMQNPKHQIYEFKVKDKNGDIRPVIYAKDVIRDHAGQVAGLVGAFLDISAQEKAQSEIKSQKDRIGWILEGTDVGTWEWNVQSGELIINERWAAMIGYSLEELSPTSVETWIQNVHPDDLEGSNRLLHECFNGKTEYYHYECRMKHKNGGWIWILDRGKVATWTEDGEPEWMFGTHQDITQRKQMEEELSKQEARYRAFFTHGPDGVVILDPANGNIIEFNDQTCRQLGYSREEFARFSVMDIEASESPDEVVEHIRTVQEKGIEQFETRQRDKQGNIHDVHVTAQVIETEQASIFLCIWRDITEQKRAAKELRESEEKYRTLIESANEAIFFFDLEGRFIEVNNFACEKLGYSREELAELGPVGIDAPDFAGLVPERIEKIVKEGQSVHESAHLTKEGLEIPVEISARLVTYKGKPAIIAFARDITERKEAEEIIRNSNLMLSRTESISHIGSWEWEIAKDKVTWSDELFRIFKMELKPAAPSWSEHTTLYHPDDFRRLQQAVETAVSSGEPYQLELRALCKDGETRVCVARGFPEKDDSGEVTRLYGSVQDITERKQEQLRLQESEQKYRTLVTNVQQGVVIAQSEPVRLRFANPAMTEMTGYEECELLKMGEKELALLIHPDDRQRFFGNFKKRIEGQDIPTQDEYRVICKGGKTKWMSISSSQIDYFGESATLTTFMDITDRKQAAIKISESERQYRLLADNLTDVIWTRDLDLKLTYISPSVLKQSGFSVAEKMDLSLEESLTPESAATVKRIFMEELALEKIGGADPGRSRTFEIDMMCKDGSTVPVETTVSFLRNQDGAVTELIGVNRDITERKKAEKIIRASLAEKEILLKEVHHRVKNNLAVLSSLFNLQSERIRTKKQALDAFKKSRDRIQAIASVHEIVYQSDDFAALNVSEYVSTLAERLKQVYQGSTEITLDLHVADLPLNLTRAVPCGLLLNELITNALKHAFQGRETGKLTIIMDMQEDDRARIVLKDNGIGLPEESQMGIPGSLGMNLVSLLTEQLRGKLSIRVENGTEFTITFPVSDGSPSRS